MSIISIKKIGFFSIIFFCFFSACSSKPSDTEMQQSINKQLSGNENYKGVTASVSHGTVTLNGNCEGKNCVTEIGKIVKENNYVDSVINKIRQPDTNKDVPLNISLQKIISKYPGVQAEISDSVITLNGSITRQNLPPLMEEISALHKKVDDRLEVKVN